VILRIRHALVGAIVALPAIASGQPEGSPPADPIATDSDAATVRLVVPEHPYLRRRGVHLSDELRTPDDRTKPWLEWEFATGDWGGPATAPARARLDQQLTVESSKEPDQSLGFWFQLSWAPPDRNQNDLWVGGGFVYTGLIPGRDDDALGLGAAGTYLTLGPGGGSEPAPEVMLECFYSIELAPWLTLQPDLQLVLDPADGGRDAIVVGAELTIDL
jgi:hypothetical protein